MLFTWWKFGSCVRSRGKLAISRLACPFGELQLRFLSYMSMGSMLHVIFSLVNISSYMLVCEFGSVCFLDST